MYHDLQKLLLENLLPKELCINIGDVPDNIQHDTDKLCWKIDQYTIWFSNSNALQHMGNEQRQQLGTVFALSFSILMGRIVVDWEYVNDLMKERQWKTWREHVCVVASFAALTCVTLSILKAMKYKFKDSFYLPVSMYDMEQKLSINLILEHFIKKILEFFCDINAF